MKLSPPHTLAVDCGTTGCRGVLVDSDGFLVSEARIEYETYYPKHGYAEQDPSMWWLAVKNVTRKVLATARAKSDDLLGIGFCGTMAGALPVDRKGTPLRKAILYADMRARRQCEELKKSLGEETIYRVTGNPTSPVYSLTKWMWIKENEPGVFLNTSKFIQPKDFLVLKTTGQMGTDYVDASATMAFDLRQRRWSEEILNSAGIPIDMMPPPRFSTEIAGELTSQVARELGVKRGLPVVVGSGDTGALLVGVGAVESGDATVYLGGAAEIDLTTGTLLLDPAMRIPLRCHAIPGMWFSSASALTSGTALEWFTEQFYESEKEVGVYELLDKQAEDVPPGSRGLLFLPYLLGERAPIWDPKARGAYIGISISNKRVDFYRAILEGVAFSLRSIMEAYTGLGTRFQKIGISGGGARSSLWKQIISDVLGLTCLEPRYSTAASALGVSVIINVGLGMHKDFKKASDEVIKIKQTYLPNRKRKLKYDMLYKIYKKCYPSLVNVMHALTELGDPGQA